MGSQRERGYEIKDWKTEIVKRFENLAEEFELEPVDNRCPLNNVEKMHNNPFVFRKKNYQNSEEYGIKSQEVTVKASRKGVPMNIKISREG